MLTRVQKWSWLKAWAMNIAKRRGQKKSHRRTGTKTARRDYAWHVEGWNRARWTREMAPTI